ncbi:MAG: endonuclease MutS2 [Lachnospiraceae bacterium]|nr:endonuclease MutS2 [Lachnospiraceae bacterium]
MNERALRILEYDKIIRLLVEHASSPLGKEKCEALVPMTDVNDINQAQTETADATGRLLRKGRITFQGNYELFRTIQNLTLGGSLSASELLKIASLAECAARVKQYGKKEREDEPSDSLTDLFEELVPLVQLSKEIRRCILSEEEIADDASSTLKHIRRSMVITGERIHSQLNTMVNSTYRTYLQDAVITMRNNRYCIPVKAEYKGMVHGMVHDQSKAGSTFFIEPAAVVELNNKLQELSIQEQEEIEVILADLSTQAAEYTAELTLNQQNLTKLDFIFAKGGLALEMNASRPVYHEEKSLNLLKARHPLIDKKKVIPIDIRLGQDYDLLIVTGPNTGGKTVSLKTTGLLCAMGQSGLHIPARDNSELCVFTEIFADIGDEQSIEQSLSTFSAHMTNIISILEQADADSLCLFDELCAGTDPTEGAALAISILRHLHDRGIRTMATTHYSELKVFALSTNFVENACCEFNVETLSPTYRLLIGIPGKSNAFAISKKLGLSDDIIDLAKEEISEADESFEDLLSDLEQSRITIENERLQIEEYRREIESLKLQLSKKQEKLEQSRERILREANEEAREILQEAKDTADKAIRAYQKGTTIQEMEQTRQKLRDKISDKNNSLKENKQKENHKILKPEDLVLGENVEIISMGMKGTVHSKPDAKGDLFIQCGIMRTKANIKDLRIVEENPQFKEKVRKSNYSGSFSKSASISPEINLLGKTVDEALAALDKYLDDAYLSHLTSVRVVHGKGTGALRNGVHRYLKGVRYVKSFRMGEFGEGDAGVTIVEFK